MYCSSDARRGQSGLLSDAIGLFGFESELSADSRHVHAVAGVTCCCSHLPPSVFVSHSPGEASYLKRGVPQASVAKSHNRIYLLNVREGRSWPQDGLGKKIREMPMVNR